MRSLKKVLALSLVLLMVFSVAASAADVIGGGAGFKDDGQFATKSGQNAAYLLSALGIVNGVGDGSNFDPKATLTRAQFTAAAYRLATGQTADEALASAAAIAKSPAKTPIYDIGGHWAEGYIKYFVNNGIITGDDKGYFNPDAPMPGVNAVKVLLGIIGYENAVANGFTGTTWESAVTAQAQAASILNGINILRANITREDMAILFSNVLFAQVVRQNVIDINGVPTVISTEMLVDYGSQTGGTASYGNEPITVGWAKYNMRVATGLVVARGGFTLDPKFKTRANTTTINPVDAAGRLTGYYYRQTGVENGYYADETLEFGAVVPLEWLGEIVKVVYIDSNPKYLDRFDKVLSVYIDEDLTPKAGLKLEGMMAQIVNQGNNTIGGMTPNNSLFDLQDVFLNYKNVTNWSFEVPALGFTNTAADPGATPPVTAVNREQTIPGLFYPGVENASGGKPGVAQKVFMGLLTVAKIPPTSNLKFIQTTENGVYDALVITAWRYATVIEMDSYNNKLYLDLPVGFDAAAMAGNPDYRDYALSYKYGDLSSDVDKLSERQFVGFLPNCFTGKVEFRELEIVSGTVDRKYNDEKINIAGVGDKEAMPALAVWNPGEQLFTNIYAADNVNVWMDVMGAHAVKANVDELSGGSLPKVALVYSVGSDYGDYNFKQRGPGSEYSGHVTMLLSDGSTYTGWVYLKDNNANYDLIDDYLSNIYGPEDAVVVGYSKDSNGKMWLEDMSIAFNRYTKADDGVLSYNNNRGQFAYADGFIFPETNAVIFVATPIKKTVGGATTYVTNWSVVSPSKLNVTYNANNAKPGTWVTDATAFSIIAKSYKNSSNRLIVGIAGQAISSGANRDYDVYGYVTHAETVNVNGAKTILWVDNKGLADGKWDRAAGYVLDDLYDARDYMNKFVNLQGDPETNLYDPYVYLYHELGTTELVYSGFMDGLDIDDVDDAWIGGPTPLTDVDEYGFVDLLAKSVVAADVKIYDVRTNTSAKTVTLTDGEGYYYDSIGDVIFAVIGRDGSFTKTTYSDLNKINNTTGLPLNRYAAIFAFVLYDSTGKGKVIGVYCFDYDPTKDDGIHNPFADTPAR